MALLNFLLTIGLVGGTVAASMCFYQYDDTADEAEKNGKGRFKYLMKFEQ
jgi:uncharacterized membrane-anchored protein